MKWYKYPISNTEFIEFRTINASEADMFYPSIDVENAQTEEYIFNKITNNKYNINELNAGIIISIVYISFKLSGYITKHEDIIDSIESSRVSFELKLYHKMFFAKIMKYIPGVYKLDELKSMSINELLELYILCEDISGGTIYDTVKMREALLEGPKAKKKSGNKAMNSITKEELSSLKASLQAEEFDGMPIGGL